MANEKNPCSQSEERFREQLNGMERSLSGRTSRPTPCNSMMFDEESFEPIRVDLHNSGGEINFDSADALGKGESRFVEAASRAEDELGGYWSPKVEQGYEAEYQDEKWAKDHLYRSDIWLFSEEEQDPTPVPPPEVPSPKAPSPVVEPSESETESESDSDNCCMDCGEGPCKMRKMMEAGFPSMLPGIGWGGFGPYGFPMPMHQPGVPLLNLNESESEPDEDEEEEEDEDGNPIPKYDKMKLWKEVGIDKSKLKGKTMVFIEKDSDEENSGSESGSAPDSDSETTATAASTTTLLTSCADGLEDSLEVGEEEDILRWAKEKKKLADDVIQEALPLKDALIEFFTAGITKGEEVESVIAAYTDAYYAVKDALAAWREELKKLDIDANDYDIGLDSPDDLKSANVKGKGPSASAACDSVRILMKLNAKIAGLVQSLPMKEFSRLNEFMAQSQSQKRAMELQNADAEMVNDANQSQAAGDIGKQTEEAKSRSTVKSRSCFPSGKEANDESFRKNRKQVIEGLTKELNKGPSKASLAAIQELRKKSKSTLKLASDKSSTSVLDVDADLKPRSLYDVPKASMGVAESRPTRETESDALDKLRRRRFTTRSEKLASDSPLVPGLATVYPKPPKKLSWTREKSASSSEQAKLRRARLGLEINPLGLSPSAGPSSSLMRGMRKEVTSDDDDDDNIEPVTVPKKTNHLFKSVTRGSIEQSPRDVVPGIRRLTDGGRSSKLPAIDAPVLRESMTDVSGRRLYRKVRLEEPLRMSRLATLR